VARRRTAAVLVLLAAVLLALGLPLRQTHEVTRPDAFADRAERLAREPVVQAALADAATDAIVDAVVEFEPSAGDLVRREVAPRAQRVVASAAFRRAWRGTARRGLRRVVDDDRRRVVFDVGDVAGVTAEATGPLPTGLEVLLRRAGDVPVFSFRRSTVAAERTASVERASSLGLPLLAAGAAALLLAVLLSPARRATAARGGLAMLGAGLVVAAAEIVSRSLVLGAAAPGQDRDVAAAVWDELVGGLRTDALLLAGAGLLVAAIAGLAGRSRPAGRPAYPLG